MKILVLGGNGFIGSHLIDKLIAEGHSVRVFDKKYEQFRKPLDQVDYYIGEFGNRGVLSEALINVDVVVHLISTTLPKTSNEDPVFDVTSNVVETLFLLEKCVETNIKKFIFISSGGTVYGAPKNLPVKEDAQTDPICSYGICKLTIEKYLSLFKKLYNLNYVIIRPSNPFGPRQNPFGIQGAIPVFLQKIIRNDTIQIWGTGEITRDFIYVADLANAIYKTIVCNPESFVFNIGSGCGYSLNTLLVMLQTITERQLKINFTKSRTYDVKEIYLDITRAEKELGWKPVTSINDGIKYTWNFINEI